MGFSGGEVDFLRSLEGLVDFRRTLTLGRQSLRLPRADLARRLHADVWGDGFGDGFLRHLGADLVDSLDASDFEGATVIHDLNLPAPPALVGRYTAVIDAGTVEHVFNVPEALRTAMSLVAQGGHLLLMAPCNNNPGHGFYQLTPEFVFRSLSTSNGFVVVRCLLKEVHGRWYDVADPASLGRRREFRTRRPAYLFVVAARVSVVPIFAEWPQQHDYVAQWTGTSGAPAPRKTARLLSRRGAVWRVARAARTRMYPPNYRLCRDQFRVVDPLAGTVTRSDRRWPGR